MATSKEIANLVINKVESQTVYDYMVDNNLVNDDELYFVETTGESDLEFDSALSSTSENAVQNKVVNAKFDEIESIYETKSDAQLKLNEAKGYADSVKNDLLNGAGEAYDTLKELADLINENVDAIDALETVSSNKQDKITGTAGQFVVIGDDGNVTTKTIPSAEEASF